MQLKKGVSIINIQPQMIIAAMVIETVCRLFDIPCCITSGTEGKHSSNSLHYSGNALDFRTYMLTTEPLRRSFQMQIIDRLTADFDVVLEEDHLHVEYQPRGRK